MVLFNHVMKKLPARGCWSQGSAVASAAFGIVVVVAVVVVVVTSSVM